jgi:DNA primase
VFNLDKQGADWKFVIVVEGPFDAMSIDGVSIQGSEISDTQAELIDRLQREVIVVPDTDSAGRKMVDRAIELGWTVSYPIWQETCKDLNEAVVKYGKLFVLKSILAARETSRLKIELKKKKLYS